MANAIAISTCHSHQDACHARPNATAIRASASRDEGHRDGERQAAAAAPEQQPVPDRGEPVQRQRRDAEQLEPFRELLGRDRLPSGGSPVSDTTAQASTTAPSAALISPWASGRAIQPPRPPADSAANAEASSSPTGLATTNPVFDPGISTPGVASAWRPRNAAPTSSAIDTRNSRTSPCRRAISLVSRPRPTLSRAARRTIQKCAGSCWYMTSSSGRANKSSSPATGSSRRNGTDSSRPSTASAERGADPGG